MVFLFYLISNSLFFGLKMGNGFINNFALTVLLLPLCSQSFVGVELFLWPMSPSSSLLWLRWYSVATQNRISYSCHIMLLSSQSKCPWWKCRCVYIPSLHTKLVHFASRRHSFYKITQFSVSAGTPVVYPGEFAAIFWLQSPQKLLFLKGSSLDLHHAVVVVLVPIPCQ